MVQDPGLSAQGRRRFTSDREHPPPLSSFNGRTQGFGPGDRGSNPRRRKTRLARSVAERPVEARITVVRFHGQTPAIHRFVRSRWQVPRMVRDPAVNRAVRKHPVGSSPTLPATYADESAPLNIAVDTDHMKDTIPLRRRCAE